MEELKSMKKALINCVQSQINGNLKEVDEDKMKLYGDALSNHIISIIGACPIYNETYFVILASGLKINIDKTIYDAIDEYLNNFLE